MIMMNMHEAKTHFSKLVAKAHEGEEVIIAKSGKAYAKIIPILETDRKAGIAMGKVANDFFEPLDKELLDIWGH